MHVLVSIYEGAPAQNVKDVLRMVPKYAEMQEHQSGHVHILSPERSEWWRFEYQLPFEPIGFLYIFEDNTESERYYITRGERGLTKKKISDYPHPSGRKGLPHQGQQGSQDSGKAVSSKRTRKSSVAAGDEEVWD